MPLTEQEIDQFLEDVGALSDPKREKPALPTLPQKSKTSKKISYILLVTLFTLGLSVGLLINQVSIGRQFTYIAQKLSELKPIEDRSIDIDLNSTVR
ncbi:MAG: hypothetical protein S4CHLAM81_12350 [Chlamydiales bacterium]|nr:hypothetical protein [Chlamydiales bacterium]MCH9636010.1 hypothetical protein [Chlamydiales bacterium]